MISKVTPIVRRRLVAARIAAMTRGASAGLQEVESARSLAAGPLDCTAIGVLESEILALDRRLRDAVRVFETSVDPQLPDLDQRAAVLLADNKNLLLMDLFDPSATADFYHLVDVRRVLGVELRDHSAILEASHEAAAGKHFDALPAYWQQLLAAYTSQNWRARRLAEKDLSQECVQLNALDEAAYHAMVSESKEAVETVAHALMASRSPEQIGRAVDKLLSGAALKRYASQAVRMIASIADAIPDDRIGRVSDLLRLHADWMPTGWHDAALLEQTWRAVEHLAHRFDADAVRCFATRGRDHAILATSGPLRRHVIRALNALTAVVTADMHPLFANVGLALIGGKKSDTDYKESLDLLCHVAERADDKVKALIRSTVYPPGEQVSDALLMRAGPHLGWAPQQQKGFAEGARKTAIAIRKQVQRLSEGQEAEKVPGYGTFSFVTPTGQVVVSIYGALHWAEALASHRRLIDAKGLKELLDAIRDMAAERDNLISNRAALAFLLGEFVDVLRGSLRRRVVQVLESIARGHIEEPRIGQTHAAATSPLNPIKMGTGDPVDLQGSALLSLASLDREQPRVSTALHKGILLGAITSGDPEIRRYGMAAAHKCASLTPTETMAVAVAGLDSDPRVARAALGVLDDQADWDKVAWHIVVRCIESAVFSADAGYRRAAARLVSRVTTPPAELAARFGAAVNALSRDTCESVRRQLNSSSRRESPPTERTRRAKKRPKTRGTRAPTKEVPKTRSHERVATGTMKARTRSGRRSKQ